MDKEEKDSKITNQSLWTISVCTQLLNCLDWWQSIGPSGRIQNPGIVSFFLPKMIIIIIIILRILISILIAYPLPFCCQASFSPPFILLDFFFEHRFISFETVSMACSLAVHCGASSEINRIEWTAPSKQIRLRSDPWLGVLSSGARHPCTVRVARNRIRV